MSYVLPLHDTGIMTFNNLSGIDLTSNVGYLAMTALGPVSELILATGNRCSWDPFYSHGLTLIPALISNYVHYNMWGEITYPFPNFNGYTVEVWEWISNLSHVLLGMWLLIHAEIKVKPR